MWKLQVLSICFAFDQSLTSTQCSQGGKELPIVFVINRNLSLLIFDSLTIYFYSFHSPADYLPQRKARQWREELKQDLAYCSFVYITDFFFPSCNIIVCAIMMLTCLCLQSDSGCRVGLIFWAANGLGDLIYIC